MHSFNRNYTLKTCIRNIIIIVKITNNRNFKKVRSSAKHYIFSIYCLKTIDFSDGFCLVLIYVIYKLLNKYISEI